MSASGSRAGTARASSRAGASAGASAGAGAGASVGEIRSCAPPERQLAAIRASHAAGDDYWVTGIDLLILRAADRLRRAGIDVPEAQLRGVAEEVVLDVTRFVLDWAEAPAADVSAPAFEFPGALPPAIPPAVVGDGESPSW